MILNKIDATRCKFVGPRQAGFCRRSKTFGEWSSQRASIAKFEFAPMKRAVRDPVAQIGNHTSKSEASIQSGTALNAGGTENSLDGSIGSRTAQGTRRYARLLDTRNKFKMEASVSRKRRLAQMLESSQSFASVLQCCSNCKIGILQDHGSHTPLQDEGEEPMMGLASSLQTRYEHTQNQKQKQTVVSVDREHRDECTN